METRNDWHNDDHEAYERSTTVDSLTALAAAGHARAVAAERALLDREAEAKALRLHLVALAF